MVTIVVLLILATVSIDAVFSENGILKQSKETEKAQANKLAVEDEDMNRILTEYANVMADPPAPYLDTVLLKEPKITDGMTPVKYNSTNEKWEKADATQEWYDYANKEWANVVLSDATFNDDGTLDESEPYTQLVWIPRYAYKITSMYHTASESAGNIEIVFIDTDNKDIDGVEYIRNSSSEYPTATVGETTGMSDFVVHPAFDFGGTKLEGLWVGKFESSHTECTTEVTTGEATYTGSEVMTVRANVTSWRNITIGDAFATCLAMNKEDNPYGLSSNDSIVDPHMMKNTEWGAVAYLTQSTYGKNGEVWNNSNSSYITGMAGSGVNAADESSTSAYNTENGPQASTTGNEYGIYDMSGGNWERVAAYVNNGHSNLTSNGGDLVASGTASKYRDVYSSTVSDGSNAQEADYALATPANGHYGDAVYETSGSHTSTNSWYSDFSSFPYSDGPFFYRGGYCNGGSYAGVFFFRYTVGNANDVTGFRVVVPVLK